MGRIRVTRKLAIDGSCSPASRASRLRAQLMGKDSLWWKGRMAGKNTQMEKKLLNPFSSSFHTNNKTPACIKAGVLADFVEGGAFSPNFFSSNEDSLWGVSVVTDGLFIFLQSSSGSFVDSPHQAAAR